MRKLGTVLLGFVAGAAGSLLTNATNAIAKPAPKPAELNISAEDGSPRIHIGADGIFVYDADGRAVAIPNGHTLALTTRQAGADVPMVALANKDGAWVKLAGDTGTTKVSLHVKPAGEAAGANGLMVERMHWPEEK